MSCLIYPHLQAYLISLYMDCPPGMGLHCPSAEKRAAVEAAIREGVITWHAFPHNAQVHVSLFLILGDLLQKHHCASSLELQ
jgi:hypothetical protein